MLKISGNSTVKLLLALVALGFIFLTAFDSFANQPASTTLDSKVLTKTVTQTATVTSTVTSSCHSITAAGRVYCGPLFDLISYSIVAHSNSASVKFLAMYTETGIESAQFFDQGATFDLSCRSSGTSGSVFDQGQVVTCSGSGFSPAITASGYNYAMAISAYNPGDTELFLTQSWSASFLTVTP